MGMGTKIGCFFKKKLLLYLQTPERLLILESGLQLILVFCLPQPEDTSNIYFNPLLEDPKISFSCSGFS